MIIYIQQEDVTYETTKIFNTFRVPIEILTHYVANTKYKLCRCYGHCECRHSGIQQGTDAYNAYNRPR